MKKATYILLVVVLLSLVGCGTPGHSSNGSTDPAGSVSSAMNGTDGTEQSTDIQSLEKSVGGSSATNAEPIPVSNYGITLSDVVVSDTYMTDEEEPDPAYKYYYPIGMVGVWISQEDYEGWGYGTFWSYLIPTDATVTFHVTEETIAIQ